MSCLASTANRCARLVTPSVFNNILFVAKMVLNFCVMLSIIHVYATMCQRIISVHILICLFRPECKLSFCSVLFCSVPPPEVPAILYQPCSSVTIKFDCDCSSHCTSRQCSPLRRKFMECSIINPVLSLLMKHLVFGQRQKAPNFSAFHWSPHGLVSIGQHFVITRVIQLFDLFRRTHLF